MNIAIVAITARGAELARRIGREAGSGEVWLPQRLRTDDGCRYFVEPVAQLLPRLFAEVDGLVCIMATGIVVRTLAPHLRGKAVDPAVVVMDEAGRFAISLLSGHLGGANELAGELAEMLGATAVVTTATDVNGLPAWDAVARRLGYGVEPVGRIKDLNSLLLRGETIALVDRPGQVAEAFAEVPGVQLHGTFAGALQSGAAGAVFVTHRLLPDLESRQNLLVLRPRVLVVGLGCNRGTPESEIHEAVAAVLEENFLAFSSVARLATIADKADEAGLLAFAGRYALPLDFHPAEALNAVPAPSAPSAHALAAVGAKGVCEPAALLAAGGGPLLVRKQKRGNVTVAVAEIG